MAVVLAILPPARGQATGNDTAADLLTPRLSDKIRFTALSNHDGLSQVSVQAMVQDAQGFMYFGTKDGLNRYNGYEFEIFRHDPKNPNSLSNNWILTLYEDRSGLLWIGTRTGLERFDPATGQFTRFHQDPNSLSPGAVFAVVEDRAGILWVGTESGLYRLEPGTSQPGSSGPGSRRFRRYFHDPDNAHSLSHNTVQALVEDRAGTLWVGTLNGLSRLDRLPTGEQFTHFPYADDDSHIPKHRAITSLLQGRGGALWIGTRGGVLRFDPTEETFTHYRHDPDNPYSLGHNDVGSLLEDRRGTLWFGTHTGLDRFDPAEEVFTHFRHDPADPNSLSYDYIFSLYEDRAGNLWAGTAGGGASHWDPAREGFITYRHDPDDPTSLGFDTVFALHEDRSGVLWIGAHNGGLDRLDPARERFIHYRHAPNDPDSLSHDDVWTLYGDRSGNLWVGTRGGGLNRFEPSGERFIRFQHDPADPNSLSHNRVLAITQDRAGTLWIGTEGGLNHLDLATERFSSFRHQPDNPNSLSQDEVWALLEDRSGTLWIGTGKGLNRFEPGAERFIRYLNDPDDPKSLGHDFIWVLHEDRSGVLWIGTAGGGLDRFNASDGTFTHFTEADGLSNNAIYTILEDDLGRLWLSTNLGLTRFDPKTNRLMNYDVSDGLQNNEFNWDSGCRGADGLMYFGGVDGFNAFRAESFLDSPYAPPLVLTSFKIFEREAEHGLMVSHLEDIELSYKEDFFSFEFAALDFADPDKNEYAYMLEGLDADWIEAGRRRYANYTNVAPGEYTFRVKSSKRGGNYGEEASVRLTLPPPPWRSWWAWTFYSLGLAAVTWGVSAAQRGKLERERAIASRERAVSNQLRQMMMTINHELRNPLGAMRVALTSVRKRLTTEEIPPSPHGLSPDRLGKPLDILDRSITRCDHILDELIDFSSSDAPRLEPVRVDEWLHEVLDSQDIPTGIEVRREFSLPGLTVPLDREHLRRALSNICENACQAMVPTEGEQAHEGSVLTVRTHRTADRVEITVIDTGCGISPDVLPRIFEPLFSTKNFGVGLGLTIAQGILTQHGGGIEVETEADRGTRMVLCLHQEAHLRA